MAIVSLYLTIFILSMAWGSIKSSIMKTKHCCAESKAKKILAERQARLLIMNSEAPREDATKADVSNDMVEAN